MYCDAIPNRFFFNSYTSKNNGEGKEPEKGQYIEVNDEKKEGRNVYGFFFTNND